MSRTIEGPGGPIPLRIYWPAAPADSRRSPLLLFYHGGGFALGNLDTHDTICRRLCVQGDMIVVSVDYRQPPEHKFPAAPEDCYAALCWAAGEADRLGADPQRIAVAGDSAGGNLAAVVALMARDRGGPPLTYQALIYPGVDLDPASETSSRASFGTGDYFLSIADLVWIAGMYLAHARDMKHPYASPLYAQDLRGLPAALVLTAGFDPLCADGQKFADRLSAAGVPTEYRCYASTVHGFISFAGVLDLGREALSFLSGRLRQALAPSESHP